jgi:tetratricopeptide (TPR) repeat protein
MVNFFDSYNSSQFAGAHFLQGNFGIIYEKQNGGLLRPFMFKDIDESDFVDQVKNTYNIRPTMLVDSRNVKYLNLGRKAFQQGDFTSAFEWFEKSTKNALGYSGADAFYHKGLTLMNLGKYQDAAIAFQEAIRLHSSFQNKAFAAMSHFARHRR